MGFAVTTFLNARRAPSSVSSVPTSRAVSMKRFDCSGSSGFEFESRAMHPNVVHGVLKSHSERHKPMDRYFTPIFMGFVTDAEAQTIFESWRERFPASERQVDLVARHGRWLLLPPEAFALPRNAQGFPSGQDAKMKTAPRRKRQWRNLLLGLRSFRALLRWS